MTRKRPIALVNLGPEQEPNETDSCRGGFRFCHSSVRYRTHGNESKRETSLTRQKKGHDFRLQALQVFASHVYLLYVLCRLCESVVFAPVSQYTYRVNCAWRFTSTAAAVVVSFYCGNTLHADTLLYYYCKP